MTGQNPQWAVVPMEEEEEQEEEEEEEGLTRLKRYLFIRNPVYNVKYCVVLPINSSLLTVTLHSPVITPSVYTTPRL